MGLLAVMGCRQDMHNAPRYDPLRPSTFFADRSSARLPVEGTVARGLLNEDTYFHTGRQGDKMGNEMPFPVTRQVLERGRDRFNVFCAPCHSRVGDGNGMIVLRGYRKARSFHEEQMRQMPLGHFVDVMANGFGAMPDYAQQVSAEDRWHIAAYIRALQLSQAGSVQDVPAEQRQQIMTLDELRRRAGRSYVEPDTPKAPEH